MPDQNSISLCDMHSHFLPGIDDGCRTVEESLGILRACTNQNIDYVAATPHYYSRVSVEEFLRQRDDAFSRVREAMDPDEIWPKISLGAEVAYHAGLLYEERLPELCYQGTDYLLLEMPFIKWTPNMLRDVQQIPGLFGITPIIAHLERYLHMQDKRHIRDLMEMDVLVQVNAEYILYGRHPHRIRKMIRDGQIDLLGSDCHDLKDRRQNLGEAGEKLLSWGMKEELSRIRDTILMILDPYLCL